MSFWDGFEKRAAFAMKGIASGLKGTLSSGTLPGLRPRAGVSVASAFKPNPLPTPKPVAPAAAMATKINSPASMPRQVARGVSTVSLG